MVEVGTVLIEDRPAITQLLALEIQPYGGGWSVIRGINGSALGRKIHAAGWNFFFMAGEVKAVFLGSLGTTKVQKAIRRILEKVRPQNFNCLEVTRITEKRFWEFATPLSPRIRVTFNRAAISTKQLSGVQPSAMPIGPKAKRPFMAANAK
jgi:hypothetical protein